MQYRHKSSTHTYSCFLCRFLKETSSSPKGTREARVKARDGTYQRGNGSVGAVSLYHGALKLS